MGWRKWANNVNMDRIKAMVGNIKLLERRFSMSVNLRLLASITGPSPPSDVTIESIPYKPGADELTGGAGAWMGKIVEQVEDLPTKWLWNYWSKSTLR